MKYNKIKLASLLCIVLMLALFTGCNKEKTSILSSSIQDLDSSKSIIAVETGTIAEQKVKEELPKANYLIVNSPSDGYLAVQTGKADAYAGDAAIFDCAMRTGLSGLKAMEETIGEDGKVAVGISPVSQIPDLENLINSFLKEVETQGVLEDMYQRWVVNGDYSMPEIQTPDNPSFTIRIGTTGLLEPYTFYSGTELTGYEMEMMSRFALWANAKVEVLTYDWGGIIPACASGKVDCIMSNLFDTDERDESILFSNPYIKVSTALIIPDSEKKTASALPTLSQLNGKTFAIIGGTLFDEYARTYFPDSEVEYYNNTTDMITAVANKKADACLLDEPVARLITRSNSALSMVEELVVKDDYAYAAAKTDFGLQISSQMSELIQKLRSDSTLDQLKEQWLGTDDSVKTIGDWKNLPATNGTIRFVTVAQVEPFAYYKGTEIIGYDIDILVRFCEAYGYALEITDTAAGTWLTGLTGGKYDLAAAAISVTEERKENVYFSEPNYNGGIVAVVAAPKESASSSARFQTLADFQGAVIGTQTGSVFDKILSGSIEDLSFQYYDDFSSEVLALKTDMVDAVGMDEPVAKLIAAQNKELAIFPDAVEVDEYGFALQKDSPLTDQISTLIEEFKKDGTLDALQAKWFGADESIKTINLEPYDAGRETLRYAHDSTLAPMCYVGSASESLGYEVELACLFAKKLNRNLEITQTNFGSLLNMLMSGKADLVSGAMSITEERRQSVDFANTHYVGGIVLVARSEDIATQATTAMEFSSAAELSAAKARMGVRTGSIQDAYTKEYLPDTSISYFEDISDMIVSLHSGKIDGFMTTTPRVPFILRDNSDLAAFELKGPVDETAFMVARTEYGGELLAKINEFITSCRKSGQFDEIYKAWFHAGEEYPEIIDPSSLPDTNGVIRYAAQGNMEPVSFLADSELTGFEMDILTRFCKDYGYALEVTETNISGILAGITSGKYDMAGGGLAITPERRQSVDFSESYYSYGQWIIVRSISATPEVLKQTSLKTLWQQLGDSFYKNFVKEDRWKLILNGISITLIISILSALFGTIFGFGVCMLRMRNNKAVVTLTKVFIRIIQGIPIVVLLMVLYYVVFGSVNMNAVIVAVIGLSINFGVYVSEMMRTGIEAVDKGQIEASLALGYSRIQTFRKVTFPQAARHFLPVYKGEFISMVKMTSIVGYIAIQDLTKVSDIIRSRTYEAFFPLVMTAIIYFLLAWGLTSLLNLIEIRIDPKRRSREIKGIITERRYGGNND